MKNLQPLLLAVARQALTLMFSAIAAFVAWHIYSYYISAPQTRDGKIRADVVALATEVSGRVSEVHVRDNQQVQRGQVLFVLDRDRLANALERADAAVALAAERSRSARREASRYGGLVGVASDQDIAARRTQAEEAAASHRQAIAERDLARLNLESATVRSPVNGTISNFSLRPGTYASAGQPLVSIVDSESYHVAGYFEETKLPRIHPGAPVQVHVMGEAATLRGHVVGLARGIDDRERVTANGTLLANVNPTFTWIRLAQRIPVRVELDEIPEGMAMIAGRTATVTLIEDDSQGRAP